MKSVDYKLFFAVLFLIIFWMIMISSVSVYPSFRVTDLMVKKWLIQESYNHFYVIRNISHVIISLIVLWILVKLPYTFFEKYSKYLIWFTTILLMIVLIIWSSWNWARWWINLPFLPFAIQPTEFLKFTLIIYFASFFKKYKPFIHTFSDGFLPFIFILGVLVILIWAQPDFGTIMVIVPVSFFMFFIAWANVKYLLVLVLAWMLLSFSVYFIWKYDKSKPETRNKFSYITNRIDNFLSDNKTIIKNSENSDSNYQIEQALIAIWSWWFTGLWFWQSIQKFWYLPEVQWDFIFSVIAEELWFLWVFVLILIYLYIWYRWFYISYYSKDLFAKYVAIWISSWILLQAFINIWVNLNIVPLTWITLPFVSYWGSSLLSLILWLSLLLNISRYIVVESPKRRNIRKNPLFF
jgi:cell division protein FtsW